MDHRMILVVVGISFGGKATGCHTDCWQNWILDCQDYKCLGHTTSGVYHVTPAGTFTGYDVYCDMETNGGGWLVIKRRTGGTTDFNRHWVDYEKGFVNVTEEFWIGFLALRRIMAQGHYELRIDLTDWQDNRAYAQYNLFEIGHAKDKYELFVTGYSWDAEDSLTAHSGQRFSTPDSDNDSKDDGHCGQLKKSGWWFKGCVTSNLNGEYLGNLQAGATQITPGDGLIWNKWKGMTYPLKTTEMKIRRV